MSAKTNELLIEIGTEELPPKALKTLAYSFLHECKNRLIAEGLIAANNEPDLYYSPRRLAILVFDVKYKQSDQQIDRYGPAINIAYDKEGNPTRAAEGFARSCNTTVDKIKQKEGKLFFSFTEPGKTAAEIIPVIIKESLAKLPIPKHMRWGSGAVEFIRPVHWVVLLFGNKVIDCEILGVRSGNKTFGHRHHSPKAIPVKSPSDYVRLLRDAKVWVNDRQNSLGREISRQANRLADKIKGIALNSEPESELTAEIAALVEWPVAVDGNYAPDFLELPEEILIATLEDQQRYYPLRNKKTGKLLPHFITIANIESNNIQAVREGNERVIVPRLTDAMFFWQTDKSITLESRSSALDGIIFQNRLGSLGDKMRRVTKLAEFISISINGNTQHVTRAAKLAKCDLVTDLVGEFPELQGIIGKYLAQHDSEPDEVASAIEEHYLPRFAGDRLPGTPTGQTLAIADKVDTICGIFAIGLVPTGEKDPFALRRAALGVIRIIIEGNLAIDLGQLLDHSAKTFNDEIKADKVTAGVLDFILDRLRSYLKDRGYAVDEIDSVLSLEDIQLDHVMPRLDAIKMFRSLPEGMALAAANKRIQNILRQAGNGDIHAITPAIEASHMVADEEKDLCKKLGEIAKKVQPLTAAGDYTNALRELARLRDPVDAFFDKVMVMVDDEILRKTRLQLLAEIHREFQNIADVSKLQG